MGMYRKKPIVIEAVRWTGTNTVEVADFMGGSPGFSMGNSTPEENTVSIETLEGTMKATQGDLIIKGVNGEFYPCKSDIFDKTYEPA